MLWGNKYPISLYKIINLPSQNKHISQLVGSIIIIIILRLGFFLFVNNCKCLLTTVFC